MPTHSEVRLVPYEAKDVFEMVGDIGKYPDFLPWCAGARIRKEEVVEGHKVITADLIIAYKMFRERFSSEVTLYPETLKVDISYKDGPFKYLNSHWKVCPLDEGSEIDFYVDFEFKSRMLQSMVARVFTKAVHKMVSAFIDRADALYGPDSTPKVD
ncbi:MAG: coenzyme Q-binding protein COQ10 [Parvibaculaceae bacterium]|jgi:coenzyme Q-binding protein COQ10|tara:strand:- start:728 stop:1195 length:468 start_codon:yes stop_codon:yes gene_type:complete